MWYRKAQQWMNEPRSPSCDAFIMIDSFRRRCVDEVQGWLRYKCRLSDSASSSSCKYCRSRDDTRDYKRLNKSVLLSSVCYFCAAQSRCLHHRPASRISLDIDWVRWLSCRPHKTIERAISLWALQAAFFPHRTNLSETCPVVISCSRVLLIEALSIVSTWVHPARRQRVRSCVFIEESSGCWCFINFRRFVTVRDFRCSPSTDTARAAANRDFHDHFRWQLPNRQPVSGLLHFCVSCPRINKRKLETAVWINCYGWKCLSLRQQNNYCYELLDGGRYW